MGTNYYVQQQKPCECCGRPFEQLHIGKSSYGWKFLFAPYEHLGLTSGKAWFNYLNNKVIIDEYDEPHDIVAFREMVESKQGGICALTAPVEAWGPSSREGRERTDADGYRICNTAGFS